MSNPMKNPQDQTNKAVSKSSTQSLRRVQAKTNKANGSSSNLLHGSTILETRETHGKGRVVDNENEEIVQKGHGGGGGDCCGRERLKKHQDEVAGQVLIPDTWGQEDLLKDWIDCSAFEALLVPNKIASARKALAADGRSRASAHHQQLRIESRC